MALAAAWMWKRRGRGQLRQVGVLSQLFLYPVKSCKGLSLPEAECTALGLKHGELRDRHWLVIKENGGNVTACLQPKLVLISVSCEGGFLTLSAPGMENIAISMTLPSSNPIWNCRVFGHNIEGKDCGDKIADWIKAFLKGSEQYRLVQAEPHMKQRQSKEAFALYTRNDQIVYSDIAPVMLLSEASLTDLNSRLEKKVKIQNFRPGIVVSGCTAFEEDTWDEIIIGTVRLKRVMACSRCVITTVDTDTGIMDKKEPLKTLRSYRLCKPSEKKYYKQSPLFGQYFGVEKIGTLKIGDPVFTIVS